MSYWVETCENADDVRYKAYLVTQKRMEWRKIPDPIPTPVPPPIFDHDPLVGGYREIVAAILQVTREWQSCNLQSHGIRVINIQREVCKAWNIDLNDLKSQRRTNKYVQPRHASMVLCKLLTGHSYPEIGRRTGDRDHTTILHACNKYQWAAERLKAELPPDAPLGTYVARIKELFEERIPRKTYG